MIIDSIHTFEEELHGSELSSCDYLYKLLTTEQLNFVLL